MAKKWIGFTVAIKCKEAVGSYEGVIDEVNSIKQTLTLTEVFKDGKPFHCYKLTIKAHDIDSVVIIKDPKQVNRYDAQKSLNKQTLRYPEQAPVNKLKQSFMAPKYTKKNCFFLDKSDQTHQNQFCDKDLECFGSHIDSQLASEAFDFQKNLALFDKESSRKEFISSHHSDVTKNPGIMVKCHTEENLGHQQQIVINPTANSEKFINGDNSTISKSTNLPCFVRYTKCSLTSFKNDNKPSTTKLRQIMVRSPGMKEYITDDGLIIPSITPALRRRLLDMAEDQGLSFERQNEMMGRAACELVSQLLNKSTKLNMFNNQLQRVVVMCGSHRPGAIGINCARQLAAHGFNVFVYLMEPSKFLMPVAHELALYRLTNNNTILNFSELPNTGVGIIVVALADEHTVRLPAPVSLWIQRNQAIRLSLDPPPNGTPNLEVHYSILPALPLTHSPSNGQLFLANINIPQQIFTNVGIYYKSPFGLKSTISLHDYSHKH
nr:PREDICTED: enhancer of mRNA-decapping protein 3-like [Bemisia tabaci]